MSNGKVILEGKMMDFISKTITGASTLSTQFKREDVRNAVKFSAKSTLK